MNRSFFRPPDARVARIYIPAHGMAAIMSGKSRICNLPKDAIVFDVRDADPCFGYGVNIFIHSPELPEVIEDNAMTRFIAEYAPVEAKSHENAE